MKARRRYPSRIYESIQQGFTLLELLISLSLTALITLLLFGGLQLGGKSWESADSHVEHVDEVRLVEEFLRTSLLQMQPVWFTFEEGRMPLFGGDAQMLEWVSPASEHLGLGGLMLLRLSMDETVGKKQLVMTRWLYHPEVLAGGDIPEWQPMMDVSDSGSNQELYPEIFGRHPLLLDIEGMELAYYGTKDPDEEPQWHEEWEYSRTLPELVRLRLLINDQWWPDMVVKLVGISRVRL